MSDVVVIHQALRRRESKTGKARYTIDIKSEPLIYNLDPQLLGAPAAQAMADTLRAKIQGITAEAAPATLHYRKEAGYAYKAGASWALRRYSGGKLGAMPPGQGTKAFNDSGRFAAGIVAQARKDKWVVNVPANRLDPKTGNVDRIWRRLVELVPEFANQKLLLDSPVVNRAISVGLDNLTINEPGTYDELSVVKARAQVKARNIAAVALRVLLEAVA